MSSEEPAKPRNAQPKPEPKSLDGGIALDVAHIAGFLGPEDFEPPVALSPRPAAIREDVRVLAVTLFESAKAETEVVTSATPTQGTRLKESPMAPAADRPPAIDESLPGLEEVSMEEQLVERTTISPTSKDDLTLATTRGPIIAEPLPGLEEDVKMQEQSVVNISTLSKGVEIPTRLLHHGASTEHQLWLTSSQEPKEIETETTLEVQLQQPHKNASIRATAPGQFLPPMTTDASQERALSSEDESSDSSDSSTDISSSSESSDSSSDSPTPNLGSILAQISEGDSDNDSAVNRKPRKTGEILATVHEILAPQVALPSITSVEPSETIELIGEVLSIIDSVVVVKSYEHGQYKVLDTGSLFVLEDRKVLGLVFETFGPLTQPLYSLRFPSAPDLRARHPDINPGTRVYYCPSRSTFAYTSAIRLQKGNDASNIYDEEVGEDELDFSDDEKEAEWKRRKGKGRGRTSSVASSSRGITPLPLMREGNDDISGQEMYGASPYDEPQAGRTLVDYRDPYADDTTDDGASESGRTVNVDPSHAPRGRRGRGRGRGRGRDHRSRGAGNHSTRRSYGSMAAPNAPPPRPLSPTSLHIARVTSMTPRAPNQAPQPQFGYQPHYPQYQSQQQQYDPRMYMESGAETSVGMVPAPFNFNIGGPAPIWAPTPMQNSGDGNGHINPRFFGQFGDVNPGPEFFEGAPSGGHQQ